MNAYEATYKRLEEKGFKQYKDSVIDHLGVVLFHREDVTVIIQNLDLGMELKNIKEESMRIREKLHQIKINVWNTYYILCADDENVYGEDDLFFIERDSTGLRKYVIKEEVDLNRIPFLDNQPVNLINNPIHIKENLSEDDYIIRNLYQFIEENNGADKIIPDKDIGNLIDTFLREEDNN